MKKLLPCCLTLLLIGLAAGTAWGQDAQRAIAYVQNNAQTLGLTADDVRDIQVSSAYTSRGVTYVYLQQGRQGIGVQHALINYVRVGSRERVVGSQFIAKLDTKITGSVASLGPVAAVEAAAGHLGLAVTQPLQVLDTSSEPAQPTTLSPGGMALEDIKAHLVYQPLENGEVRLAWNVDVYTLNAGNYWQVRVDAASGAFLAQNDLVVDDYWGGALFTDPLTSPAAASYAAGVPQTAAFPAARQGNPDDYFVFPLPAESPLHPAGVGTAQQVVTDPADATASPWGWHDTDGAAGAEFTITRGNNAHAYQDQSNAGSPSTPEPDGGAGLSFTFPFDFTTDPTSTSVEDNPAASVTNLFYWNNIFHDVLYQYGFDEASGNFQANNYGRGGAGGDDVRAEGQDGGGNCNANMFTPSDGSRPRMQMYLCTNGSPRRDGDLDHAVIIHEYTHGVSNRLTGGPAASGCLSNAEQAGEGWSDWYALMMTQQPADTETMARGMGTYLFGQPPTGPGIRNRPYSTDFAVNEFTYDNIKSVSVPHGVGHVWATMAWDLNWALIGNLFTDSQGGACLGDNGNGGGSGFQADLYLPGDASAAGGNNLALQLLTDGLKQQVCSPGFVDARNGILLADEAMTPGADLDPLTPDGRNAWLIWNTFARRGLGFSATQGSPFSRSDGTEAFDLPPTLPADCPTAVSPSFTLNLKRVFVKNNGTQKAVIKWSAGLVSTGKVDFYVAEEPAQPNPAGPLTLRTPNDNKVKLTVPVGGGGPLYNIQACEKNSTSACSDIVQADFSGAPIIGPDDPDYDDDVTDEAAAKGAGVPDAFTLHGLYPNPFNPSTRIEFDLPDRAEVRVAVYDLLGREVLALPVTTLEAGVRRSFEVDGSSLASGTYLYRLTATMQGDVHVATGRMVLVK